MMDFNAYWDALHSGGCMPYDYWQGANVKCGRHGMARSVTETQSHEEGIGGKKCNRSSRECMVSRFRAMHSVFSGMEL